MRPQGARIEGMEAFKEKGMDTYKEFRAKTVDQAIADACRFFAVDRDALEIEIVSGGSTGIFGLGAKKAAIRARRRRSTPSSPAAVPETAAAAVQDAGDLPPDAEAVQMEAGAEFEEDEEPRVAAVLSQEEQGRLASEVRTIMAALLRPVCAEPVLTVAVNEDVVTVHIADEENSGLIIGRDGQTITALQYLANRIVSKTWPQSPRIQLDAGDYRQKQEEQLLGMAQFLSEKAKKSGKVQSTRPLSSFHRRVVHMALQDDKEVQTRSKGEGSKKRVLILPVKRAKSPGRSPRSGGPSQTRES